MCCFRCIQQHKCFLHKVGHLGCAHTLMEGCACVHRVSMCLRFSNALHITGLMTAWFIEAGVVQQCKKASQDCTLIEGHKFI